MNPEKPDGAQPPENTPRIVPDASEVFPQPPKPLIPPDAPGANVTPEHRIWKKQCVRRRGKDGKRCPRKALEGHKYCDRCQKRVENLKRRPGLKDASYSKYLPTGLLRDFKIASKDPNLLSLRQDIALLHTRIQQLIRNLHTGESGSLWNDLKDVYLDLAAAMQSDDQEQKALVMSAFAALLQKGIREEEIWKSVMDTIDKKSQLSAREWKRMVELNQIVTVDEVMFLMSQVVLAIRENVTDQAALVNIGKKIHVIMNSRSEQFESAADPDANLLLKQ